MIGFSVVCGDDDPLDRCQQRAPEAGEPLGRVRVHEGAERDRRCASGVVDWHEVDCVGRGEQGRAMTGNTIGGAVLGEPATSERVFQVDGSFHAVPLYDPVPSL